MHCFTGFRKTLLTSRHVVPGLPNRVNLYRFMHGEERDGRERFVCEALTLKFLCNTFRNWNGVTRRLVVDDRCGAHIGWDPSK